MEKYTHLTDADRLEIEHGLRHGLSLKKIAAKIGKRPSICSPLPAEPMC